ncbi:MAG: SDR family NAD(P)-dependent oxidoreductase [Opitutales bacterium]
MSETNGSLSRIRAVIVTGGSSGIGKAIIEALAPFPQIRIFLNLSRSIPVLEIEEERVHHFPCDLSDFGQLAGTAAEIVQLLAERAPEGEILLINNSGFGAYGPFPADGLPNQLGMIDLNIRAMVDLTGRLLPLLCERGGRVMNIASTAAFQPTPYMATYGATKAFVLHWTLALDADLREQGVRCLCVCPGPTSTNFFKRAGFDEAPLHGGMGQTSEQVAAAALRALDRNRTLVVCGLGNKVLSGFSSLLPVRWSNAIAKRILKAWRLDAKAR